MGDFRKYIEKMYKNRSQITLLSYFYAIVAVIFIFIAGVCALVSQPFGVALLIIPLIAVSALCANVTVWALLKLAIEHLIQSYKNSKNDKKSTKK